MNPLELSGERFRHLAADVVEMTAEYLSTLHQRRVFPVTSGAETERLFAKNKNEDAPESGLGEAALAALAGVIAHSRAQNGRFFGYVQVPPSRSPPWAISSPPS